MRKRILWSIVSENQEQGRSHPNPKQGHRDRRGEPIVAMDHGDRDQRTDGLHDEA